MMKMNVLFFLGLFVQASPLYTPSNPPNFKNFSVDLNQERGALAVIKPVLKSKTAKQYRTVIRLEAGSTANFAGHFRVISWGCGTDCRNFAILNQMTGAVYTMPGVDAIVGVMNNADDRLSFKVDSKLFIISGQLNEKPPGKKFYYLWTGHALKLIYSVPLS